LKVSITESGAAMSAESYPFGGSAVL
jgi:hypothetical protein